VDGDLVSGAAVEAGVGAGAGAAAGAGPAPLTTGGGFLGTAIRLCAKLVLPAGAVPNCGANTGKAHNRDVSDSVQFGLT
jgi:hypothetical protein